MRRFHVLLVVGLLCTFLAGFTLGQDQSKFAPYLQPASPSIMDMMLVQADLVQLREYVGTAKGGIAPPRFFFDGNTNKIRAFVLVDGSFLAAESSASLRARLSALAIGVLRDLRISIPELSEGDLEVDFRNLSGNGPVDFAEYRDGSLILH